MYKPMHLVIPRECERTVLALIVLEQLHALKSSGTTNEFVGKLSLALRVVGPAILLIDLLISIFRFTCSSEKTG